MVIDIALESIDDNPFNPRKHYPQAKAKEMAQSLREVGLRQIPEGRHVDGRVQLAYGHMRKRGYLQNQKKDPEHWKTMPVDVKEISDQDMFHYSMEENLRRTDITPIEVARCIEAFSEMFSDMLDEDIARKHNMTAANVSNMKRVLRLPDKFLEKIDAGQISFTQGRELLALENVPDAENLMASALGGLRTGNKAYGHSNTVEGLQQSIHDVIGSHFRPLDKRWEGYRWDLLFDTGEAGCLKCDKMIQTRPTKSESAHYCLDAECWDRHQEEHREKAAAAAKAKMEAEVLERAARDVAQRTPEPAAAYKMKKRGTSWIAIDDQGRIIAINHDKEVAEEIAKASFEPVATILNPSTEEYKLNHTYRISRKWDLRKPDDIFDVTAQDLATAVKALGVDVENIEHVKVWKSSGKIGTGGGISAGWSNCPESLADISQEMLAQWRCGQCNVYFEFSPPGDNSKALVECPSCQYEYVTYRRADGVLFCLPKHNYDELPKVKIPSTLLSAANEEELDETDRWMEKVAKDQEAIAMEREGRAELDQIEAEADERDRQMEEEVLSEDIRRRLEAAPAKEPETPEELLQKAREAAGTRAQVLDVHPLYSNVWRRELKNGYAILNDVIDQLDDPQECLERCTRGFHYAFDSGHLDRSQLAVCTDPKCVAKKKAAFTRAKNAEGQARKKAETKAVKEAIAQTTSLDRASMKLIILAQIKGAHAERNYFYGQDTKAPEKWLWDKISAGTPDLERKTETLFKKFDKLTDEELAKLIVEFMFYYLVDHGDIGTYKIKAEEPLRWMGISIEPGGCEENHA